MADEYTVKRGDCLSRIAQTHGITLSELLNANPQFSQNGRDADHIYPGEKVVIPINPTFSNQTNLKNGQTDCNDETDDPLDEADDEANDEADDVIDETNFTVTLITPGVDPVSSPNSTVGDMAQNEYTYSTASPGVLTITVRAEVTPAEEINIAKPRVKFSVDAIAGSTLVWDGAGDGSASRINGAYLESTVTFTTLPPNNSDFGTKKARLFKDGSEVENRDYEVFFPRDAKNHPGGDANAPNWLHYWSQVAGFANTKYAGASGSGTMAQVRGMTAWSYASAPDKTNMWIFDEVVTKARAYGIGVEVSGIDNFVTTVNHENKHVDQINRADGLVPSVQCWQYGWSWNTGSHNHWGPGPDGLYGPAPGVAEGTVTVSPPFEIGGGDDVNLSELSIAPYNNWPATWPLPSPMAPLSPIEREAVNAGDAATPSDHGFAASDWADPGKNHNTPLKWDD